MKQDQKKSRKMYSLMIKEGNKLLLQFFLQNRNLQIRYNNIINPGVNCKKAHILPFISETIIVEHIYKDQYSKWKNISKGLEDDSLIEIDEEKVQDEYYEFFDDVYPEWSKFGSMLIFMVSFSILK